MFNLSLEMFDYWQIIHYAFVYLALFYLYSYGSNINYINVICEDDRKIFSYLYIISLIKLNSFVDKSIVL